MTEVDQLTKAIHRLSTCEHAWDRPALEKAVLLWAGRTHGHVKTIEGLLDRQLTWLDANEDHPRYEERFADWISNLRLYERTWDVLREVYGLNIGVAA
jgi:hypothetical protein